MTKLFICSTLVNLDGLTKILHGIKCQCTGGLTTQYNFIPRKYDFFGKSS